MSLSDFGPFSGGNTAIVQDQRTSGVAGDTIIATTSDQTINTVVQDRSFLGTLLSNKIPLDAGAYRIYIEDTCLIAGATTDQWALITDDLNAVLDSTKWPAGANTSNTSSRLGWVANISLSVQTDIKYRCGSTFGSSTRTPTSQGTEYYQKLIIEKVG